VKAGAEGSAGVVIAPLGPTTPEDLAAVTRDKSLERLDDTFAAGAKMQLMD
jgi:hypothetical protein